MEEFPVLLTDLILIFVVVAVMTVISKKLNLPLIIGYISAGFLVGPVIDFVPTVTQTEVLHIFSDIGVIFLMFNLGLSFSLHKFLQVGKTCGLAAIAQILGMILSGFVVGQLLGWTKLDSVFSGMMLAMSSTVITIKVISDAGKSKEEFAVLSTGTLIIEDILTVFMMVIVSALAARSAAMNIESNGSVALSLLSLLIYLSLWLFLGIYLLPTMFRKGQKLLNDETLLMLTLGICFGMVWLANYLGFSSSLGAFLAGSIFACTVQSPTIEKLIGPCKDLFGVIFFVSVGLLIEPTILVSNFGAIIALAITDIVGDFIILFITMNATGQNLYTSLHCSTCQAQIGEFSFVIAGLGISLGLTSDFLYPVIIAVSVVTIMFSPFMLRLADPLYSFCLKVLSEETIKKLNHEVKKPKKEINFDRDFTFFLKEYVGSILIYSLIIVGLCMVGKAFVIPALENYIPANWANIAMCVMTYLIMIPLLAPMTVVRKRYYMALRYKHPEKKNKLNILAGLRMVLAVILIALPLTWIIGVKSYITLPLAAYAVFCIYRKHTLLMGWYMQVYIQFMTNLNEKQLMEEQHTEGKHAWLSKRLWVEEFVCEDGCGIQGQTLMESDLRRRWHVTILKIIRNGNHINIPNAHEKIQAGDILHISGEMKDLENLEANIRKTRLFIRTETPGCFMRQYIKLQQNYDEKDRLVCACMKVGKNTPLVNTSVLNSQIYRFWNSNLIAVERGFYPMVNPRSSMIFKSDDVLWAIGSESNRPDYFIPDDFDEDTFVQSSEATRSGLL